MPVRQGDLQLTRKAGLSNTPYISMSCNHRKAGSNVQKIMKTMLCKRVAENRSLPAGEKNSKYMVEWLAKTYARGLAHSNLGAKSHPSSGLALTGLNKWFVAKLALQRNGLTKLYPVKPINRHYGDTTEYNMVGSPGENGVRLVYCPLINKYRRQLLPKSHVVTDIPELNVLHPISRPFGCRNLGWSSIFPFHLRGTLSYALTDNQG